MMLTEEPPPPFIADHRLIQLVRKSDSATKAEQKAWLRPETFRWRREDDDRFQQAPEEFTEDWAWEVVQDRTVFLADLSPRLRAITVNAGVGKTIAAMQTQYLLQQMHPDHLCILANFSRLPEKSGAIWNDNLEQSDLVNWFLAEEATASAPRAAVAQLIGQKIAAGKFTFIVEAFDQTTAGRDVHRQAEALQTFLKVNPKVRCVCTGRPHAIVDKFWDDLFGYDEWQFIQIDTFDKEQAEAFVGQGRWNLCKRLDATELFVPRSLEAVRGIKAKNLEGVTTASQVYWRCLLHTFEKALVTQNEDDFRSPDGSWEIKKHDALHLFALLAFECNRQGLLDGVPAGKPFRKYLKKLFDRHETSLRTELDIGSKRKLEATLTTLARLNAAIDFAALDHEGVTQVIFQNRTLQDFFAAIWMCTQASKKDRSWFTKHRLVRWQADTSTHYQMWKLAVEMPEESVGNMVSRDDDLWIKMVRPLFVPSTPENQAIRSTEMIYRSWTTLEEFARGSGATKKAATKVLGGYRTEYLSILRGDCGPDSRKIAQDFESWFIDIDPTAAGWSEGDVDNNGEPLPVVEHNYRMSKYTVTNELFSLFDGRLSERYEANEHTDQKEYGNRGRVPVVSIDWYDAWCVSQWLGGYLPHESEWEYACRAGTRTTYAVGNGTKLTSDDARCGQKKWAAQAVEVDSLTGNAWGLCQMHGNVREWCENWYGGDQSSRCLRGGSFYFAPQDCRSACRSWNFPADSYLNNGVRLSRVAMQ